VTVAPGDRAGRLLADLGSDGPAVLARAPGRVNLIGEHTDYNGLPVLPFAIERDVLVAACRRAGEVVEVASTDPRFPPRCYRAASPIPSFGAGDWGNYAKAATQALLDAGIPLAAGGMALRVDGTIPLAAGVSSSSALVVALALAQLALAGTSLERLALAELLARGERYVGVLSGGMDQAAILLGRPGHALRLDFFPLRAHAVAVPPGAAFVVAHSLEDAPKSGVARGRYNQRVIECRLACAVLSHRLRRPVTHLGELAGAAETHDELLDLLPDGVRSRAELRRDAGLAPGELEGLLPPTVSLADPDRFVLRRRVRHVLGEAARVAAAERALATADLRALGTLLDASHASGAADYETSTPKADALVRLARESGALGARLMGAGFGGAVLALVEHDRAAALLATLDDRFYGPRGAGPHARFVAAPSAGASVARVDCREGVC
jgi:N-acetylgalactosamine kinase